MRAALKIQKKTKKQKTNKQKKLLVIIKTKSSVRNEVLNEMNGHSLFSLSHIPGEILLSAEMRVQHQFYFIF